MHRPIFVWEPVPDSCVPSELPALLETMEYVDVLSPNLDEFATLLDVKIDVDERSGRQILERKCNEVLALGFGSKPSAIVVRLGERGCYCAQFVRQFFFPAFHGPSSDPAVEKFYSDLHEFKVRKKNANRVVDPTGGGNAFLGGLCIGLLTERHPRGLTEFEVGCIYGSIAASFAIEQVGMPTLSHSEIDEQELWNGQSVHHRMREYENGLDIWPLTEAQLRKASLYEPAVNAKDDRRMVRKGAPPERSLHEALALLG